MRPCELIQLQLDGIKAAVADAEARADFLRQIRAATCCREQGNAGAPLRRARVLPFRVIEGGRDAS